MWLLNAETLKLEEFLDDRRIKRQYAILSHTWEDEEVSFDEIHLEAAKSKKGYDKIRKTCRQAVADGLKYAWVDTCCIDKRSSAELSESINSMYRYYYNAHVCYAYLSDLAPGTGSPMTRRLRDCRWFKRGWTLQELVAPRSVTFYDSEWNAIASRTALSKALANITHIKQSVLVDREELWNTSVATRMSWASTRNTTREEDIAYSLLGLFDVNMPLLYGEGSKAFKRLQEEIIKTWDRVDHSILAHGASYHGSGHLLASSPAEFLPRHCDPHLNRGNRAINSWPLACDDTFVLTNRGLTMTALARAVPNEILDASPSDASSSMLFHERDQSSMTNILEYQGSARRQDERLLVVLKCGYSDSREMLAMYVRRRPRFDYLQTDACEDTLYEFEGQYDLVQKDAVHEFKWATLTIARTRFRWSLPSGIAILWKSRTCSVKEATPAGAWKLNYGQQLLMVTAQRSTGELLIERHERRHRWQDQDFTIAVEPILHGLHGKQPYLQVRTLGDVLDIHSSANHNVPVRGYTELVISVRMTYTTNRIVWFLTIDDPDSEARRYLSLKTDNEMRDDECLRELSQDERNKDNF
ncbi:hypothetical protein FKW77_007995 [Venturia effusa]|uniref:Heterokaryon incompatibility domain-containing protein n=1 Tax=Venturia effusa TaxID=50376 RepID=A0A517LLX6_9PEZI|nr:hypothetical protein FKW77_007995 [Venturia effusa]